jgi:hypothetical protein
MISAAKRFVKHWDWIMIVPSDWLRSDVFVKFLLGCNRKALRNRYVHNSILLWSMLLFSMWMIWYLFPSADYKVYTLFAFILVSVGLTIQKLMVDIVIEDYMESLVDRNTISPLVRDVRDRHIGHICAACGIVGALYGIARAYRTWTRMRSQGSLEPRTQEEVDARDREQNVWTQVCQRKLPVLPAAANTTSNQLIGLVDKNLVYGTVVAGDRTLMANGLFLRSNVVVLPDHYFEKDVLDVTFRKVNPDSAGGKFCARLSKQLSYKPPGTDLRFCYISSGGSFKDLTRYLTDEELPPHEFTMMWRSRSGEVCQPRGLAVITDTGNRSVDFRGYRYDNLTMNTFQGLCGAVCIARRRAIITSIHLGGNAGTPSGCAGVLRRSFAADAYTYLRLQEGVLLSGTAERFETQVLGVNVLTNQPLHPKSPLNYMPQESQVEYYGSCLGKTKFHSDVKVTPISHIVTDVTGSPNVFGPPVVRPEYFGWQTCLANLANPALPYDPNLLSLAIRDYKDDMLDIFARDMWKISRPLTDKENLCGIPGKKFMDAIKLNTSIGYPLSGDKRRFVTELDPTEDEPNNREFDPLIMEEIQRCEDCYRRGERAYTIAKACKKDEILSKPKCRIFYGNAIALTWLIRKYYLPILRVMQMNPLKSECAVGVNSHGPEWDELHNHILHFGKERIIGGDYGKYDQKLPSQLIFAALRIMIDFARECDYSDEDLRIMEAMTGDIVFAVIAYNGDLIGLTEGTHISGNSLTVCINGICGSLNLRCYFYSEYPTEDFDTRKKFRDFVSLMTYGDDNIGSVSPEIDRFTIKGASKFLESFGQTYTMPDKESELLDFLPMEDFEFLKRKSVYHHCLGRHVGALIDKSCFKMLHCYVRGKDAPLTEDHACALNVDTALREWFNHGKDVFEERREQMKEVASLAGITHLCAELDLTYEDRVSAWKDKYERGAYVMFNEPDGFTV